MQPMPSMEAQHDSRPVHVDPTVLGGGILTVAAAVHGRRLVASVTTALTGRAMSSCCWRSGATAAICAPRPTTPGTPLMLWHTATQRATGI